MTSNTMPVIIAPVKPLLRKKDIQTATVMGSDRESFSKLKTSQQEESKEGAEKNVPFLQVVINMVET